jgi:hypothetical protein
MFKKIADALGRRAAEGKLEHGLRIVRRDWLEYRSRNPKPSEENIIQYVAPFVAPMIARLGHDRQWRDMGQTARLDLIFVVLRADAETEGGLDKLAAMRDALLPQDD